MIGRLLGFVESGREILVSIAIDKDRETIKHLEALKDKEISVDLARFDADHSHSQRKYFHRLNYLLAKKKRISQQRCKNDLLSKCGILLRLEDGNPIVVKINVEPEIAAESGTNHLEFIKYENDGYFYKVLKGTSDMTVSEYNQLIDVAIYECRTEGIQTDTPEELARYKALWEK